jgi:hypothetical protein
MAIVIDRASMTLLPTDDPLVVDVTLDYTKDTLEAGREYLAVWKTVTFKWNTNQPATEFMAAVQAAIAKERTENAALKAVKGTIAGAVSNIQGGMVRSDPSAKPAQGSAPENPMYVKVVT